MTPTTRVRILAAAAPALFLAGCSDLNSPSADPPAQYITVRRAWNPGERDSLIAHVEATHAWIFPYVGDVSGYAPLILADTESVTVAIANPAYTPAGLSLANIVMGQQWATSWNITGIDVKSINNTQAPPDTLRSVGVFWSNPAEANWVGFAIAFSRNPTLAQTTINTTAYDAAFGKAGAGAGEVRNSTATTWIGNGPGTAPNNTMVINSAAYGGTSTVTTGPFLGGTSANGSMQGRLRMIPITRTVGATLPVTQTVDLDFSAAAIGAIQFVCKFKVPCTTNVP